MPQVYPSTFPEGPMAFMEALANWSRLEITVKPKPDLGWIEQRAEIGDDLEDALAGDFFITLAREDEMSDDVIYFTVRAAIPSDLEIVRQKYG